MGASGAAGFTEADSNVADWAEIAPGHVVANAHTTQTNARNRLLWFISDCCLHVWCNSGWTFLISKSLSFLAFTLIFA